MPELELDIERDPLEALAEEFVLRHRRGEDPPLDEYIARDPAHADEILALFPAMLLMEHARPTPGPAPVGPEPERIGDFRILREVGRGGMGIVYEAEQESLGRRVALKVLPGHALLRENLRERFYREARTVARLHHAHIVPVYGVGREHELHYIVMQFVDGQSLEQLLAELRAGSEQAQRPTPWPHDALHATTAELKPAELARAKPSEGDSQQGLTLHEFSPLVPRPISAGKPAITAPGFWRKIANVGVQAADALEHAHRRGVFHRDIKPSNLLLDRGGHLWITDFGLAKVAVPSDTPQDGALTASGDILGTIGYMAPERFQGVADARSDVYSLGLTLYELLARRPAFAAEDRVALVRDVIHNEPLQLAQVDPHIPRDLRTIVSKAIEKDPGRRYATAGEMAEDLRAWLDDRPIRARRVTAAGRSWRWCRRNPAVAALAACLALVVVTGFAGVLHEMNRAQVHEADAVRDRNDAQAAHRKLQETTDRLRGAHYDAGVLLAEHAYESRGGLSRARELLTSLLPGRDEPDLRGFEWHYLNRLCHPETRKLADHTARISCLAYSPDGAWLATGSLDGTARLWDVATGRVHSVLQGHGRRVDAVAFTPDGRRLATAGPSANASPQAAAAVVLLWDVETGQLLRSIDAGSPLRVNHIAFGRDGASILVSGDIPARTLNDSDPALRLFDVRSGDQIQNAVLPGAAIAALSPDGARLATQQPNGTVQLAEFPSGRLIRVLENTPRLWVLRWSSESRYLAGGWSDGLITWDAETGKELGRAHEHHSDLRNLAFSPDGSQVAAGSWNDGTIRLYNVSACRETGTLRGHELAVFGLAFHPHGGELASGGTESEALLWDLDRSPKPILLDAPASAPARILSLNPNGTRLVSTHERIDRRTQDHSYETRLWDVRARKEIWVRDGLAAPGIVVTAAGERFATWNTGKLVVWNAGDGSEVVQLPAPAGLDRVLLHPDGERVICVCQRLIEPQRHVPVLHVIRVSTGEQLNELVGTPGHAVLDAVIAQNGQAVALGFGWGTSTTDYHSRVEAWNLSDGSRRWLAESDHDTSIGPMHLGVGRDGQELAVVRKPRTIQVWDIALQQERQPLKGHSGLVRGLAVSPDGRRLASASWDQTVKLWDLRTGQEVLTLRGGSFFHSVTFSGDGQNLAAGEKERILIWRTGS